MSATLYMRGTTQGSMVANNFCQDDGSEKKQPSHSLIVVLFATRNVRYYTTKRRIKGDRVAPLSRKGSSNTM